MYNINAAKQLFTTFASEEDGAQVVEYGLIIAVVSIALVLALAKIAAGDGPFTEFITRVTSCLTTAVCK